MAVVPVLVSQDTEPIAAEFLSQGFDFGSVIILLVGLMAGTEGRSLS
jgi:hypothetical protein